MVNNEIMTIEI